MKCPYTEYELAQSVVAPQIKYRGPHLHGAKCSVMDICTLDLESTCNDLCTACDKYLCVLNALVIQIYV